MGLEGELNGYDLFGHARTHELPGILRKRFKLPPFSVLSARDHWWQERKRAWLSLGIKSELGRGENGRDVIPGGGGGGCWGHAGQKAAKYARTFGQDIMRGEHSFDPDEETEQGNGTSIFDPVLCELVYSWFCPDGGVVLDPFAGGSVRGVVASKMELSYFGIELRPEQVKENRDQALDICGRPMPVWREGDSRGAAEICGDVDADLIFTCPPYVDLEQYSDDPRDLSTLAYPAFLEALQTCITSAAARLKPNRFACVVVGDVRGGDGNYYGLPAATVRAFSQAGMAFYNEAILVTSVGSLPIRVTKQFETSRKLGKTHQNVYVFLKGDARLAATACGGNLAA